MDGDGERLDYSIMDGSEPHIPVYALYGERSTDGFADRVHWETLASRSRHHEFRISPHRHERLFQIVVVRQGHVRVDLDGTRSAPDTPVVLVTPALAVHGYAFSRDIDGVVLSLYQSDVDAALKDGMEGSEVGREAIILSGQHAVADVDAAIDALIAESQRSGPGHRMSIKARVDLVLSALVRAHASLAPRSAEPETRAMTHARAFAILVDAQYREHRSIDVLAEQVGITASHLNRISRTVLGDTPLGIVEQRRMLEAKRLLVFTAMSVKQVALTLGYGDPAYFSRAFARREGCSPMAYRTKHGS